MNVTHGPLTWLGRFWVATRSHKVVEVGFGFDPPDHEGEDPLGRRTAEQIRDFLEKDRREIDVPLDWDVLPPAHREMLRTLYYNVPWGQFVTYGEMAAMAGFPGAARAAGTACRMCPFPVIVPLHRVIAAGGRIGGFAGRPDLKRRLLAREGLGPFRD